MTIAFNSRQIAILEQIKRDGRVLVEDLADFYATTPQTIRRDLQLLADTGEVMRFHGGASLPVGLEYTGFDLRNTFATAEKEAIGKAIAARIPNNSMIMINGGTTTAAVARALKLHAGVRVVTDNVNLANDLRRNAGLEILVPGGTVRKTDGAILGEGAVDYIRQFRADIAVIGAAAVDLEGTLLDFDMREVHMTRAIMQCCKHVILAVDASKFTRSAPVRIGALNEVQTIVTDKAIPVTLADMCDEAGISVIITP